jgi:radical SAM superfamily enzyme YgiQ (UPF0313 family)
MLNLGSGCRAQGKGRFLAKPIPSYLKQHRRIGDNGSRDRPMQRRLEGYVKKKIGILELCSNTATNLSEYLVDLIDRKQYVGVTPQAISVWCRQIGHQVHYATYYGIGDPKEKLPNDLDIIFISATSRQAPLAYALSKVFRMEGTRTVLGGPHAKSFPREAGRFFDLVVLECDQALIRDIIAGCFEPQSIISSQKPYDDIPTIEERLPEIKASTFWKGKPFAYSLIPMLASVGCPYTCDFCTEWNRSYRALSSDRLAEDLRYTSANLPGVKLLFCDPNFGIRFDETLAAFETVPAGRRSPYAMETALTNLCSLERLHRLRDTHCLAVAHGIESWTQYSSKAGVGKSGGGEKMNRVLERLQTIQEYVPYIQANFILGLDTDAGDEPFELTKEFLARTPFLYPTLNIPVAFGGTPFYDNLLKEGRILKTMPLSCCGEHFLTVILKHYDALSYYQRMADLFSFLVSDKLSRRRLAAKTPRFVKAMYVYRNFAYRVLLADMQKIAHRLQTDPQLRAFHAGETRVVPDIYATTYKRQLGRYAALMPTEASQPVFD